MYQVMRFDFLNGWRYFNAFETYSEAAEAVLRYVRIYGGTFRIQSN